MPQLVVVHPRMAESCSHRIPVVVEAAFRETPRPRRDEEPGHVEPRRNVRQRVPRRRRQDLRPLQAVLRSLDLPRAVEALTDVTSSRRTSPRSRANNSPDEAHVGREENHRPEARPELAMHSQSDLPKLVDLVPCQRGQILSPTRLLQRRFANGFGPGCTPSLIASLNIARTTRTFDCGAPSAQPLALRRSTSASRTCANSSANAFSP